MESSQQWIERLESLAYSPRDRDLLRFVDSELDDRVRQCVAQLATVGPEVLATVIERDSLAADTVALFAERQTLRALRSGSMGAAMDAFQGRLVAARDPFEQWRQGVLFSCFAATSLGALDDSLQNVAAGFQDESLENIVADVLDNLTRVHTLRDVGRVEVHSHYGLGVLHVQLVKPERLSGGLFMYPAAPILVRSADQKFDSDSELAELAIAISDSIELQPSLKVGAVQISEFPGDVLITAGLREHVAARTCLAMIVDDESAQRSVFQCFVAEMLESDAVDAVLDAIDSSAGADGYFGASGVGRFLVLLFDLPDFDADFGEFESDEGSDDDVDTEEVTRSATESEGAAMIGRIESALSAFKFTNVTSEE